MSGVTLQNIVRHDEMSKEEKDVQSASTEAGNDTVLSSYISNTPELSEIFLLLSNSVKILKENLGTDKFYLTSEVQKQAFILNDAYAKQSKKELKIKQAEFLVDIGFSKVAKDILVNLPGSYNDLFTFDREIEKKRDKESQNESVLVS